MDNQLKLNYVKRIQIDYNLTFKLQVVSEIEPEERSANIANWIKKCDNLDRELEVKFIMEKSLEQCLIELEAQVHLLEK